MAAYKDVDKERELRRLRRENLREQEERNRRMEELRAVQAQKEHFMRMFQLKEQQLQQAQADVMSSHEDFTQSKRLDGEIQEFQEFGKEREDEQVTIHSEGQYYSSPRAGLSSEKDDASGILYRGTHERQRQGIRTEDNVLQRKQEKAKSRRIIYSAGDRNKKTEASGNMPEQENRETSSFLEMMEKEINILDRRLSQLREQGFIHDTSRTENNSNKKEVTNEIINDDQDRLGSGKEYGGVRKKDKLRENREAPTERERLVQTPFTLEEKDKVAERLRRGVDSEKEMEFDPVDQIRKHLRFDSIGHTDLERNERGSIVGKPHENGAYFNDYKYGLAEDKSEMRNFESQIISKVCEELRTQNQQLLLVEQNRMEKRLMARKEEVRHQSQQFLFEEQEKMEKYLKAREEEMKQKEADLRKREDVIRQQEIMLQEVKPMKDFVLNREEESKKREEELKEKEEWLKQQEAFWQEVSPFKNSLAQQKEEVNRKLEFMKLKEAELAQKEEILKRVSVEQERAQARREAEFEEKIMRILNRKVENLDVEVKEGDSSESKKRSLIKQESYEKKEILKEPKESEIERSRTEPVSMHGQKISSELSRHDKNVTITEVKQTVLDSQCIYPKFSPFSGDDPKPKMEASFEEWKYEVECTRKEKEHSNTAITQAVRKSLRGQAKRVILPLGTSAKIEEDIMERLENVFGNVASGQSILKEFYTAAQKENETVTAWGLRLEEIFQRAIEKGKARKEDRDSTLREQFWKSLRSERLKNATRVKYENVESFELLRKAVRAEENEMKLVTNISQQQTKPQTKSEDVSQDKLDLILKRIEALEKERKRGYRGGWNPYRRNQNNNQNNRSAENKNQKPKEDQGGVTTQVKEPLNG